jgi:hypothetical protein
MFMKVLKLFNFYILILRLMQCLRAEIIQKYHLLHMFAVEFTWNVYFEHVLESIINGIDKVNESVCGMESDEMRMGWEGFDAILQVDRKLEQSYCYTMRLQFK